MQRLVTIVDNRPPNTPGQWALNLERAFRLQAAGALLFVVICTTVAVVFGTDPDPDQHFREGGLIDVFSALFLTLAGAFAWSCVLLQGRLPDPRRSLWLLMAVGFLFLAFDELLEFHETIDVWLRNTWLGWPPLFRNWSDVVVIGYGVAGVAVLARFWSEIRQLPRTAILLGLGGVFYGLHTAIGTLVSGSALKTMVEESVKLAATSFLALAMLAALLAILASADDEAGQSEARPLGLAG